MRFRPLIILALFFAPLAACMPNDYWALDEELTVDASAGRYRAKMAAPLKQDFFLRYQVDYKLSNRQASSGYAVVVATSYVNSIVRARAQRVWKLAGGDSISGILENAELELGNSIDVELQCCRASRCSRRQVSCPSGSLGPEVAALFCYQSCADMTLCQQSCPAESACEKLCEKAEGKAECRQKHCAYGGSAASCPMLCLGDSACLNSCKLSAECQEDCVSLRASCYKNCLSTWTICTDQIYEPSSQTLPCALCGGTGLCRSNLDPNDAGRLQTLDGSRSYDCSLSCRYYPATCVSGCEELFESDVDRVACLERCLQQQLYWCNDNNLIYDYIDSRGQQPCCFDQSCQHQLEAVIKTMPVHCLNDSDCGQTQYCDKTGLCLSTGQSSCQLSSKRRPPQAAPLLLGLVLLALLYCARRRRSRRTL